MDCRKCLPVAAWLMAGALGCVHQEVAPQAVVDPTSTRAVARESSAASDKPKKTPKPETCVAFGNLHERAASDPAQPPSNQEASRDQARRAYAQALEIDPHFLAALTGMARLHEGAGEHDQAVAFYRKALKKHARDAAVWHELGMLHAKHKEWDPALECLGKASSLEPSNHAYGKTLGFCLARAGRFDESHACLKKVMGEAEAHFCVARMLLHLNQTEAGVQHLQAALQVNPRLEKAQSLLAEVQADPGVVQAGHEEPAPE